MEQSTMSLQEIADQTRYPIDAFYFVRHGLDYTVHQIHIAPDMMEEHERHVNGRQLSQGLREYALVQYGLLAKTVLNRWHIQTTRDFGEIVFAMVNGGLMQATEHDNITDFEGGYDFDQAFDIEIPVTEIPLEWHVHSPQTDA